MNCEELLEYVYEFINSQDLTEVKIKEIRWHVEECRHCFDRYEFEERLVIRCRTASRTICPDALKKKIHILLDNY